MQEWRLDIQFPVPGQEAELPPASFCDLLLKRSRSAERGGGQERASGSEGWEGP